MAYRKRNWRRHTRRSFKRSRGSFKKRGGFKRRRNSPLRIGVRF